MRDLAERDAAEARPEPPFRTYGLVAPVIAPLALAETQQRDGVWRSVVLGHGDWAEPAGPLVRVETCSPEPGSETQGASWYLLRELERERDRAVDYFGADVREPDESDEPPEFAPISLPVDGVPMTGLIARQGGLWAARVPVHELTVLIVGRGVEPDQVRLAAVGSLAPYWQGRDEMLGRRAIARIRERHEVVLAPAEGIEAFRVLIEVTLADQGERKQAARERRPPRRDAVHGAHRQALWQRAVTQQALRSGGGAAEADELVTLIVNLLGHLQNQAPWFTGDPELRADAIDETLRFHLYGEDVSSRAAQEAWIRYWPSHFQVGGGWIRHQGYLASGVPGWLEAWQSWARSR